MDYVAYRRRDFLRKASLLGLAGFMPFSCLPKMKSIEAFQKSLNPGAIGAELKPEELLIMADKYGFDAIVPSLQDWETLTNADALNEKRQQMEITWDAANLPVEFRKGEDTHKADLERLKTYGSLMEKLSVKSCSTWIMPTNQELTYLENFQQHTVRLREIASVLANYNVKLGLEYVGPKTLMARDRHPFISSLKEVKELISAIGKDNVGIQLDSFHWFCAEESYDDILGLSSDEIITCDLNDAVKGRSVDQQIDYERELPASTGVIDVKLFLEALKAINYTGPIRAEPFNARLNALSVEEAVEKTSESMERAFELIN